MKKTDQLCAAVVWALSLLGQSSAVIASSDGLPDNATQQAHDRAADAGLRGKYEDAIRGFTEILRAQPSNGLAYYNRGNIRYFRREFELAVEDYTSALKYRPGFLAALMNRGVALSHLDRLDEALADLDQAADLAPYDPEIFSNRLILRVKRGNMEQALEDYDRIIRLDIAAADNNGVRTRLDALLATVDASGLTELERKRRIVSELDHARTIESLLELTERSCIRLGDDTRNLATFADREGWQRASDAQLERESTPTTKITGGWTFSHRRLGKIAVVQTRSARDPNLRSCLITARYGDPHWFEDFATLFSDRFQSPRLSIYERPDRLISQQVVVRPDQVRINVVLSQTTGTKIFTLKTSRDSAPR